MFSYRAYGLDICSELPLPGTFSRDGGCDLSIRLGAVPCDHGNSDDFVDVTPQEVCFFWKPMGTILVRNGKEIVVEPAANSNQQLIRHFILTAGIAMIFHQRGVYVLHASAVSIHGNCVAFVGESGWGKSTTAAYFKKTKHRLIVDDVLPVFVESGTPVVFPGFAYNRVRPDAATFLGEPEREHKPAPAEQALPLKRVYLLQEGTQVQIAPIPPRDAFITFTAHSYVGHLTGSYNADVLSLSDTTLWHFDQCVRLAQSIPMYRLIRPLSLSALPALTQLVVEDATGNLSPQPLAE